MEINREIKNITSAFVLEDNLTECVPYGSGHINDTYRLTYDTGKHYILQNKCTGDILYLPVNFHSIIPPIISVDTALHLLNSEWQLLPQVYLLCRLRHTIYP